MAWFLRRLARCVRIHHDLLHIGDCVRRGRSEPSQGRLGVPRRYALLTAILLATVLPPVAGPLAAQDPAEEIRSLARQIEQLLGDGRIGDAIPLMRRRASILRDVFGEAHSEYRAAASQLAVHLVDYARELWQAGDLGAAGQCLRESVALQRAIAERDDAFFATTLHYLARLLHEIGDPGAAEPLYREAADIRRQTLGPDSPDLATTLNNLALVLGNLGEYDAAERTYREALAIQQRVLGSTTPITPGR